MEKYFECYPVIDENGCYSDDEEYVLINYVVVDYAVDGKAMLSLLTYCCRAQFPSYFSK